MKLPKNYFKNLSASKYREYLRLLPNMQNENTRIITTLIFTFFALTFFGIFAINPTITTIVELKRKLADSQLVHERLKTKINNLFSLQQQYNNLAPDLPFVLEAIPQSPQPSSLLAQVLGLSKQTGVAVLGLDVENIILLDNQTASDTTLPQETLTQDEFIQPLPETDLNEKPIDKSFKFSLRAEGTYEALMEFANSLAKIQRLVKIDYMSIKTQADKSNLVIDLEGRSYFKE